MKLLKVPSKKTSKAPHILGSHETMIRITGLLLAVLAFNLLRGFDLPLAIFMGLGMAGMSLFAPIYKGIAGTCAVGCACLNVPANSGVGCNFLMAVEKYSWFFPLATKAGVLNYIDLTVALNAAYFSGLTNNVDPTARLYPFPEIADITDVRDKPVFFTNKNGVKWFVRNNVRTYEGMFMPDSASPQLTGVIEALRCVASLGKYTVDANGTVWGILSADGTKLYPAKIVSQSVAALFTKPTDDAPEMLGMAYDYHPSMQDCQLAGIPASAFLGGFSALGLPGLLNIYLVPKSAVHGTSTIVVDLNDGWGSALPPEPVTGLLKANFALYDNTTPGAIVLNTVTENVNKPGEYTVVTTTSFNAADVLVFTITKTGYDGTPASTVQIIAT